MLRAVWFTPTVAQSDRGADWFRCDVIAVAGTEKLAPLTGRSAVCWHRREGRDRVRHVRHRRAGSGRLRARHLLGPALVAGDLHVHLRRREVPRRGARPQRR